MAINVTKLVWETNLTSAEKLVLLAFADHASSDGSDVYPGTARIVRMSGFSDRWVREVRRRLIDRGLLVETKAATWNKPAHYRIDLHILRQLGTGEEQSSPPAPASAPDETATTPLNPVPNPPEPSAPKPPIEPSVEPPLGVESEIDKEVEKIHQRAIDSGKIIDSPSKYRAGIRNRVAPRIEKAATTKATAEAQQQRIAACQLCNSDGNVAWESDGGLRSAKCTHNPTDYAGRDVITRQETE